MLYKGIKSRGRTIESNAKIPLWNNLEAHHKCTVSTVVRAARQHNSAFSINSTCIIFRYYIEILYNTSPLWFLPAIQTFPPDVRYHQLLRAWRRLFFTASVGFLRSVHVGYSRKPPFPVIFLKIDIFSSSYFIFSSDFSLSLPFVAQTPWSRSRIFSSLPTTTAYAFDIYTVGRVHYLHPSSTSG